MERIRSVSNIQLFHHCLLRTLSLAYWIDFALLSQISWLYLCECGCFSAFLFCSIDLYIFFSPSSQYHAVLITVPLCKSWYWIVSALQLCLPPQYRVDYSGYFRFWYIQLGSSCQYPKNLLELWLKFPLLYRSSRVDHLDVLTALVFQPINMEYISIY